MANIQNLKEKVTKAQENVEKKKATIVRHEKQLAKKIEVLEKLSGRAVDLTNMDSYKWIDGKSTDYYWEACDVTGKLNDIKGANKKLKEAEVVLSNWESKLQKELDKEDFINNSIPQVIIDFLNAWKQMAYDWHVKKYEAFVSFKQDLYKREAEAIKECEHMTWRGRREYMEEKGLDNISEQLVHFGGVVIVEMDIRKNEEERLAYLEATLEAEKKRKAIDLMNRIKDIVGEITDASGIRVNEKLNLDGIIYGTKGDAKIATIGAGGYAVQCFHYRTLVHAVK